MTSAFAPFGVATAESSPLPIPVADSGGYFSLNGKIINFCSISGTVESGWRSPV